MFLIPKKKVQNLSSLLDSFRQYRQSQISHASLRQNTTLKVYQNCLSSQLNSLSNTRKLFGLLPASLCWITFIKYNRQNSFSNWINSAAISLSPQLYFQHISKSQHTTSISIQFISSNPEDKYYALSELLSTNFEATAYQGFIKATPLFMIAFAVKDYFYLSQLQIYCQKLKNVPLSARFRLGMNYFTFEAYFDSTNLMLESEILSLYLDSVEFGSKPTNSTGIFLRLVLEARYFAVIYYYSSSLLLDFAFSALLLAYLPIYFRVLTVRSRLLRMSLKKVFFSLSNDFLNSLSFRSLLLYKPSFYFPLLLLVSNAVLLFSWYFRGTYRRYCGVFPNRFLDTPPLL